MIKDIILYWEQEVRELDKNENPTYKEMRTIKKRVSVVLSLKQFDAYMATEVWEERERWLKNLID